MSSEEFFYAFSHVSVFLLNVIYIPAILFPVEKPYYHHVVVVIVVAVVVVYVVAVPLLYRSNPRWNVR